MSKASVLVIFVLAVAALGEGLRSCTRQFTKIPEAKELWETWQGFVVRGIEYPFGDSSLCTDKKYPFCILSNEGTPSFIVNNRTTYEYSCAECRYDCDCPIGKYCSSVNGVNVKDFGRCVSYSAIVGKKCDPSYNNDEDLFAAGFSDEEAQNRDKYYNPEKYCVVMKVVKQINNVQDPSYNVVSFNSSHIVQAFKGACVLGTCYECNSLLTYKTFEQNAGYTYGGYSNYPFFSGMGRCKPSSNDYAPWYYKFVSGGSPSNGALISEYNTKPRYCHNFKFHYLNQDDVGRN